MPPLWKVPGSKHKPRLGPIPSHLPSKVRCLVLGSSFVRRLYDECRRRDLLNFGLPVSSVEVAWRGVGGATVDSFLDNTVAMSWLSAIQPHVVIIQVGSNDLCEVVDGEAPDAFLTGHRVMQLAEWCIQQFGVYRVLISGVFYRTKVSNYVRDVLEYNRKVDLLNRYLHVSCGVERRIRFWHHENVLSLRPDSTIDRDDGVHFNQKGQVLYYYSVRGALLAGIKTYLEEDGGARL